MLFLKLTELSGFKIRSSLLSIIRPYSETSKKDLFDILQEKVEEDVGYDQWLASTKEALTNSKGKFWLGKSSPFPYNSAFVPKPVISDSSKSKIFELFKQNSKLNDHRALALQFKVSIERIRAIIKQKELELDLAKQGKVVNKEFVSAIESNLECADTAEEYSTTNDQIKKLPFRPTFACVPEGRTFNFQDAKNVFIASGINVKSPNVDKAIAGSISEIDTSKLNTSVIGHSVFEKSRSKFVFVDLSEKGKSENNIIVRDTEGTLRTATREEIDDACSKTWNRNRPKN